MTSEADAPEETLWQGRYLAAKRRGKWEYVARTGGISAAVILAVDAGEVILIEQYRVPLGANCLELPAGLIGDETEGEEAAVAAIRELEEETGYRAAAMTDLGRFHSSPGISISLSCGEPAPAFTGAGQSFHSHRMASGKISVACLPLWPPSPQT